MSVEQANLDACKQFRAHYDEQLARHVGFQVPEPRLGQDVNEYRAECCRTFKRAFLAPVDPLYKVNYWQLVANEHIDAFNQFEKQLLPRCREEAFNPAHVPVGQLREIVKVNPANGLKEHLFIGQQSFVVDPSYGYRPGRHVASFNTPNGPVGANGLFLR
jgi:hypothetical protein